MLSGKLAVLVTAAGMAVATPAHAVDYRFSLTGSAVSSFTLSSLPSPDYALNGAAFVLYDVRGTYPGSTSSIADLTFYSTRQGGGFKIHDFSSDVDLLVTHGLQLYTGTERAPSFRLGTFQLTPDAGLARYTLTISSLAAAAPEPGTWGMMILGFGAAGVALRRRRRVVTRVAYAV